MWVNARSHRGDVNRPSWWLHTEFPGSATRACVSRVTNKERTMVDSVAPEKALGAPFPRRWSSAARVRFNLRCVYTPRRFVRTHSARRGSSSIHNQSPLAPVFAMSLNVGDTVTTVRRNTLKTSRISSEISWDKRLWYDLFCVKWDVKTSTQSISKSEKIKRTSKLLISFSFWSRVENRVSRYHRQCTE